MTRKHSKAWDRAARLAVVVTFYLMVSLSFFAWRHPHLTQTQVMQHVGDALLWREVR